MNRESFKRNLALKLFPLRILVLRVLRYTQRDITIKHPYSNLEFELNSFKHKAYWYYGKYREQNTMEAFRKLISEGDVVVEVGGHIGFVSHYFSVLVGEKGKVFVFEPGINNLAYTRRNISILPNAELIEQGCSNSNGKSRFYEDSLTGQNNSILSDYKHVEEVSKSHKEAVNRRITEIETVKLADFIENGGVVPDFIKIDVEGMELQVLLGLEEYLGKVKKLMIEVTENYETVVKLLESKGYKLFKDDLAMIERGPLMTENIFAILR